MHCSEGGSLASAGKGALEPLRIEAGQDGVRRMSAVLAPWRALASASE